MNRDQIPTSLTSKQHCASAFVTVDGIRAKVYGIEEAGNKLSGFIESKEGGSFTVTVVDTQKSPTNDRVVNLILDGSKVAGFVTAKDSVKYTTCKGDLGREMKFKGTKVAENLQKPFTFGKVQLTDDEEIASSYWQREDSIKKLGVISIKIWRARIKGQTIRTQNNYPNTQQIVINEQVKKAGVSHQINFGEAVSCSPSSRYVTELIDHRNTPQMSFEFHYVSREILELKGFIEMPIPLLSSEIASDPTTPRQIPSSPSPTPLQDNDSSNDANSDNEEAKALLSKAALEIKKLEATVRETKEKLARRRGRSSQADISSKKIKVKDGVRVKKEVDDRDLGTIIIQDDSDED